MTQKRKKISPSQLYAIEYIKKNKGAFVSFNSHLHASTVKSLRKIGVIKDDPKRNGYVILNPNWKL